MRKDFQCLYNSNNCAGTLNFPYLEDVYFIYKSNVPFIDKESVICSKALQIRNSGPIQVSSSSYIKESL